MSRPLGRNHEARALDRTHIMPPQSASQALHLGLLPGLFSISQFSVEDTLNEALVDKLRQPGGRFISITRTIEEVSVVEEVAGSEGHEGEWKCIKIKGPMDFGMLFKTVQEAWPKSS